MDIPFGGKLNCAFVYHPVWNSFSSQDGYGLFHTVRKRDLLVTYVDENNRLSLPLRPRSPVAWFASVAHRFKVMLFFFVCFVTTLCVTQFTRLFRTFIGRRRHHRRRMCGYFSLLITPHTPHIPNKFNLQ